MTSLLKILINDGLRWSILFSVIASLGVTWIFLSRAPTNISIGDTMPPSPREGFPAPDFTLEKMGGGQVKLSDLRGNVIMVNLWATWCPPCRAEMPAIEKVYQSYKALGFEVLGVNLTNQDREELIADFVQELGLTFPILLDRTGEVSTAYNLRGLPTTFFIDRNGVIQTVVVGGPMSEALIQSKVEDLLQAGD